MNRSFLNNPLPTYDDIRNKRSSLVEDFLFLGCLQLTMAVRIQFAGKQNKFCFF